MSPKSLIVFIILFEFVFDLVVSYLKTSNINPKIPKDFKKIYKVKSYQKSINYMVTNEKFSLIKGTFSLGLTIIFIFAGIGNSIDTFARGFNLGTPLTGLIFFSLIFLGLTIIGLPFSYYHTFIIEERFGFNKSSKGTFFKDQIISFILGFIIGGVILFILISLFDTLGSSAWLWAWLALTLIQIVLIYLSPVLILPLFNKFTPLEKGSTRSAIMSYLNKVNFHVQGLYTMDGSKRSTKTNAFFTGFGRFKKIALFDTLIKNHNDQELVAVLAHEVGHYKLKHTVKLLALAIISSGAMLFFFSLLISSQSLASGLNIQTPSIYANFLVASILFTPAMTIFGVIANIFSRRFERQADSFAKATASGKDLGKALKKLSVDNLSYLRPHPLVVFLEYSHPPVLERLARLKQ